MTKACSPPNATIDIKQCRSGLLIIKSQETNDTYLTFCDDISYKYQLPLIFMMAILLLLFALSSVVIVKILHKIVDPSFALSFSIKCFPIRLFGYIWPEDQINLLGPVLHFILNPSQETLQESNTKLMSKTGRDLLSWSIKNEYVEIIRTILDIAGKVIKKTSPKVK